MITLDKFDIETNTEQIVPVILLTNDCDTAPFSDTSRGTNQISVNERLIKLTSSVVTSGQYMLMELPFASIRKSNNISAHVSTEATCSTHGRASKM